MREIIHVIPENDLKEHVPYRHCHCNPVIKDGVCVHNSFDGREVFEQAAELLNNKN